MSNASGKFWDLQGYQEKQWFRIVAIGLISLVSIYILLHLTASGNKYEFAKLDQNEIQQISKIYFTDSVNINKAAKDKQQVKIDSADIKNKTDSVDTTHKNTATGNPTITDLKKLKPKIKKVDFSRCDSIDKCERVIQYLKSEYQIDTEQIDSFREYLCCAKPLEATGFLSNLKLRVRSYFWLTGPTSYFEIIFWTLFGVLCNILFSLGIISKKSTNNPNEPATYFDSSEIPSQVAKIFYAPLSTLVIVFGYNYFTGQSLADISSSKGIIVFAYVGGFYSERLIAFLDRLKDVLLPNSGKADVPQTKQAALRNAVIQLIKPTQPTGVPDMIPTIDLSTAIVTLTYQQTGETSFAKNIDKSQHSLFIADFIKPGMYKIDVNLNTKDAAGTAFLFIGNLEIEMKTVDLFIRLQLNIS